jgi:hypothetical protein
MNTQKMRTTVYLPADLVEMAKIVASERKMSFTRLVGKSLQAELGVKERKKVFKMGSYSMGDYKFKREDAYE